MKRTVFVTGQQDDRHAIQGQSTRLEHHSKSYSGVSMPSSTS